MSSAKQNKHIAKLIVGAMTIDGSLDQSEREKVAFTLDDIGMGELIADVGAAIEEDDGTFNLIEECKEVMASLGAEAREFTPLIFRVVVDVVSSDRFVSVREAAYLSALSKRLELSTDLAKKIFKQVLAKNRSRLETAASGVDESINPHLKELLSFQGSEDLVGEVDPNSAAELAHRASQAGHAITVSSEDLGRALAILGLPSKGKLEDAEAVWKDTIDNLNLPKMANLGETFVSAAIARITRINDAYKTILQFYKQIGKAR